MRIKRIGNHYLSLPQYHSKSAAGLDLSSAIRYSLLPLERKLVPCGFAFEIPDNFVGLIRDRSGCAVRGLTTRAGVIDSDYRGEVKVLLVNENPDTQIMVNIGDRIAQMLIMPAALLEIVEAEELDDTVRGENGFGSTGG